MTPEEIETAAKSIVELARLGYAEEPVLRRAVEILSEPPPVECPWPVRDCEPGYRWVRPGEKLEEGDEWSFGLAWSCYDFSVDSRTPVVQNKSRVLEWPYGFYRRKVTPKQSYDELVKERDAWAEAAAGHVTRVKELTDAGKSKDALVNHLNEELSKRHDRIKELERRITAAKLSELKDILVIEDAAARNNMKRIREDLFSMATKPLFVRIDYDQNRVFSGESFVDVRVSSIDSVQQDTDGLCTIRSGGCILHITPESAERVKLALGLAKP